MRGNKQTGLTHLHVYTLVIYRMERETVACIIITACRSLRKDTPQQFSRFLVYNEIKIDRSMKKQVDSLQLNSNPHEQELSDKRKQGLLTGLLVGAPMGFYINSLETGMNKTQLITMQSANSWLKNEEASTEMLHFLRGEGDRTTYEILLPYLLSTTHKEALEETIRQRFFGVEQFVRHASNLYQFFTTAQEKHALSIKEKDLERGILAWDMSRLVNFARIAYEAENITEEVAWEHIEFAGEQCRQKFKRWEEAGKSFILGKAMKSNQLESIDQSVACFHSITNSRNKPWEE